MTCQYRLPHGTCNKAHTYAEHIRSLPASEQIATHNLDGTPRRWTDRARAGMLPPADRTGDMTMR